MDVLLQLWFIWAFACCLMVVFGVAMPLVKWYDCWLGVYYDRDFKMLYMFPIPMIGCVIYLGKHEKPADEVKVIKRYIVDIPESVYREIETLANAKDVAPIILIRQFIEGGIEVEQMLDEPMSPEDMAIIHGMNGKHKENEHDA